MKINYQIFAFVFLGFFPTFIYSSPSVSSTGDGFVLTTSSPSQTVCTDEDVATFTIDIAPVGNFAGTIEMHAEGNPVTTSVSFSQMRIPISGPHFSYHDYIRTTFTK